MRDLDDAGMTSLPQAGAIAVRLLDDEPPRFLVVSAKRSAAWIFPKGGIEPGESAEAAALRELREEAGYDGRILSAVGAAEFDGRKGPVHVEYYLVQAGREAGPGEDRDVRWCGYKEARRLLAHDDARRLLDRALEILEGASQGT